MTHAQTAHRVSATAPIILRSIECATLDDIEDLEDEIDSYVCSIRRHEQHEHYLCDELEEDIF